MTPFDLKWAASVIIFVVCASTALLGAYLGGMLQEIRAQLKAPKSYDQEVQEASVRAAKDFWDKRQGGTRA